MKRRVFAFLSVAALSVGCGGTDDVAETSAAAGGNVFRGETTTAGGLPTWDSDMVNIEKVTQTGAGVYVAVLDTGLVPNWSDYFPGARVSTQLGTGFDQPVTFGTRGDDPCALGFEVGNLSQTTWVGSTGSTHGTHVTSTIIGYFYDSNADTVGGFPLPPLIVRGIAPDVTIIPVKVLADYQIPARPNCTNPGPIPAQSAVFGTSAMVAAGIDYVTSLKRGGLRNSAVVINMSLGGSALDPVEKTAIDNAIAAGVIVVAAAGNEGTAGMSFPGAYAPVISAGSAGWIYEWLNPANLTSTERYRLWWLQSSFYPFKDVAEGGALAAETYVSDFSSRQLAGQQLDVLAPGSWVRGPFAGDPGFSHLPWWSKGIGDLVGGNPGNFFYVGGTSMATPHVASIAAMMAQKNPRLTQAQVESILKSTALRISAGTASVHNGQVGAAAAFETISWGRDAVGSGLVQADAALAATR
jgi:subtilisin family serine protease